MASWLFGVSKLTAEQIVDTKDDTPPAPTTVNPEPVKTVPTESQLLYDLQPPEPKIADLKPTSMLDNIPFVLSNQIITTTNNYTYNLENTKRHLLSLKKALESDAFNYDFSNDKRLHSKFVSNGLKDNVNPVLLDDTDHHWFNCICFNIFH
ncbi:uncharacterized protein LOC132927229 isoform X2 [Rhopalosiphum padi]|uniref:uncharacterized protein LOC132927229 isoform X2 n=1 Tax=Rhopalosiphum padi TaxID=40932 RepID=UPI00298EAC3A|nr:uncharacterized protein LOC132927229 isoform X2 [Rhopalosiphum padi]